MNWSEEELSGLELGDTRLEKRAEQMLACFSEKPTLSIPGACNGWGETQAAYRFFAHEGIDWPAILAPHQQRTEERISAHPVVLCIEDTTELDFHGQQIEGLGRLSYEAQRGLYLHPTYAVTPERVPLGILNTHIWTRGPKCITTPGEIKEEKAKESQRWVDGYTRVATLAQTIEHTRLVYVSDREGDIVELMELARDMGNPADWLIRSQHNRILPKSVPEETSAPEIETKKLWESVESESPLTEICFSLKSRRKGKKKDSRQARKVRQQVYVKRVTLPDRQGGTVDATCVVARETDPPAGEEAVVWRLLTNREVLTEERAIELIEWYRARWEIEMFFDILKNGCRVEALQLSTLERIECALALYLIVAWRIAHLMRLGRTCPDMDARLLFDAEEIQAAYLLAKKPVPKEAPRLNEVISQIAKLGGFLARKHDGAPGTKTLWIGLQRLVDFIAGMHAARNSCV